MSIAHPTKTRHKTGIFCKRLIQETGIKYGSMETSDTKRLKELNEENSKLKKMYAELSLKNKVLKKLFTKRVADSGIKDCAGMLLSEKIEFKRACLVSGIFRATWYRSKKTGAKSILLT